jgi:DDE superfamily endonuclease
MYGLDLLERMLNASARSYSRQSWAVNSRALRPTRRHRLFIGDMRDASQPTISRYVAVLVPLVKSALEEFTPSVADAIEVVRGKVVLVDGTLTPCWSYEDHQELWNKKHKTTGFNAQLISLLDGTAVWVSGLVTPKKKPKGGELTMSDKEYNCQISSFRAPIERLVGHFKNWKILHTDYRRPYSTYQEAFDAARALFFFSITWGFE